MRQLSQSLAANLAVLDKMFGTSADYYAKEITIYHCRGSILLFDGMASLDSLWELLLDAASRQTPPQQAGQRCTGPQVFELILHGSAFPAESEPVTDLADLIKRMTAGMAVLLLDGCAKGIAFSVQGLKFRSVDEPSGEGNLRGSREGFADLLRVNLSLLRRLIRTEHLVQEVAQADTEMQTEYAICYCKNRADSAMVIRVRKALAAAKPELLLDSSYFVPWLLPGKARLFTPVSYTERPAVAAAKICEGKIVVLVNGSPSAMVLPALFCENFECLDDYASTAVFSSFLRILKYVSFYLTVFLPGVFVCLAVYLPELIPPQLLYKIEAAEKATPLPLFAEMLLVILILEVIREAGLRMPQSLGHSVSLVSALIIGDAAIATGLMSTPVIFVASITAIAVFVTPSLYEPATLLRLGVVLAAGLAGPVGLAGLFLQFCSVFPAQPACRCHIWRRIRSRSGPWKRMASSAATTAVFQRTTLISGRNGRENDAKTERLFCSRAGTERVDSCAGRRNADRYLSAWDDHSWSGSGSFAHMHQWGVLCLLAAGSHAVGLAVFRRSMVSGRVVWNRNAGPEHLPAGVPLHGADRPAAAFALGRVVYSAFRLGCSGTGAVVVRAAGWAGLSDRACRADGLGAPADGRCCATGPLAACSAVCGVFALAASCRL